MLSYLCLGGHVVYHFIPFLPRVASLRTEDRGHGACLTGFASLTDQESTGFAYAKYHGCEWHHFPPVSRATLDSLS